MLKKSFLVLISVFLIIIIAGSLFLLQSSRKVVVRPPTPTPTPTPDPLRPYSILMLGYGGGSHEGGLLTDSMVVVRVEPHQSLVTLISIPRDLWLPIPISTTENKYSKINAAFVGGGQLSKIVASQVVGFNIDYYIALDFKGFTKFIDILGGVNVPVAKTFTDNLYPLESDIVDNCGKSDDEIKALTATLSGTKLEEQFPCRYESLHFDKGLQLMSGVTALKFARSRHSPEDGGDFNRANRQRLLLEAVKNRIININFIPKIIPTINTLSSNLKTDIDLPKVRSFISQIPKLSQYKINSIALTDQNVLIDSKSSDGQFILIPKDGLDNWTTVHQYIQNPSLIPSSISFNIIDQY